MRKFAIVTDATADLSHEYIKCHSIAVIPMDYTLWDKSYTHYPDCRELPLDEFYTALRSGASSTTTQINFNVFYEYFEGILKYDLDVLYIGFSSGISGTFSVSQMVSAELGEKYPDSRIVCIDSLCASLGLAALVMKAEEMRSAGKGLDETAQWLNSNVQNVHHWFAVDDLQHLRRGGRVSPLAATLGTALGIKPILYIAPDGTLDVRAKVRGSKKSIEYLLMKFDATCIDKEQTVHIVHASNPVGAMTLADELRRRGIENTDVTKLGPIIGAHTGPGILALVYFGTQREAK